MRRKKCKACGEMFIPDRPMQKTCPTHECAIAVGRQISKQAERKALNDPHLIAVRRLEVLIGHAYGHERPEQGERVDTSSQGAPGQNVTQAMIDAHGDLKLIMREVGFTNARLLTALLAPVDSPSILTRWRKTVEDSTKEKRPEVQAVMIRTACENLALAWQAMDYRSRQSSAA